MTLDEVVRRAKACPHSISYEQRFELCGVCTLEICRPKSPSCGCRERRAQMERDRYDKNPKMQARGQKDRHTPEQWQEKLKREAEYRTGIEFKLKRSEYVDQNREAINAQRRKRRAELKLEKKA